MNYKNKTSNPFSCLKNIFTYVKSGRISRCEKVLLFAAAAIYVISPIDLLPLNPLDDIGIVGAVVAFINWRINNLPDTNAANNSTEPENRQAQ